MHMASVSSYGVAAAWRSPAPTLPGPFAAARPRTLPWAPSRPAANYAWVNRSSMTFLCRQAFAKIFQATPDDLDMHVVYDVSHNIAKAGRGAAAAGAQQSTA